MFLLFSHKLSEEQILMAEKKYHVKEFIYLPDELQKLWSGISPDIEQINEHLLPIKKFINKNFTQFDIALIQGDFGAVYNMVNFCKSLYITPVYATTKRVSEEDILSDGTSVKKSVFKFRRFREYE